MSKGAAPSNERRKAKRRPILNSFSLFVVVPKKGAHRLDIQDLSEGGIKFSFDAEGENHADFPLVSGDSLDLNLYLNQSLFVPLAVSVLRVETHAGIRQVGAEFIEKNSGGYRALKSFLQALDELSASAHLVS